MSEHQKETAFLQRCLGCDDSAEHQALDQRITQLQRDERCVRRAGWLMTVLMALAVTALGYAAILMENFPHDTSHLVIKIAATMGLTSLICLVAFAGLRMIYRLKLDQRREEGRQLVTKLFESRLDRLAPPAWREGDTGGVNCETVPLAAGRDHSSNRTDPAAGI